MSVQKVRSKPFDTEAMQYTGGAYNLEDLAIWTNGAARWREVDGRLGLYVDTLEGTSYAAKVGDWILRGPKGEFYPCDSAVFDQKYEIVGSFHDGSNF